MSKEARKTIHILKEDEIENHTIERNEVENS